MSWNRKLVGEAAIHVPLNKLVGKQRPRITRTGMIYTPKTTRDTEDIIRGVWLDKVGTRWACFGGEIHVKISAHRALPKSCPKYMVGSPNFATPDIDNVVKLVLDALTGTAYPDDRQVTQLAAVKEGYSSKDSEKASLSIEVTYYVSSRDDKNGK